MLRTSRLDLNLLVLEKLKEINKVFEYFSNKYNKHIDIYISIQIAFVTYRDEKNLIWNFLTYYKDINRYKFIGFVITSLLVGIAGIILASLMDTGQQGSAKGFELVVIAAVLLGGTSFKGYTV